MKKEITLPFSNLPEVPPPILIEAEEGVVYLDRHENALTVKIPRYTPMGNGEIIRVSITTDYGEKYKDEQTVVSEEDITFKFAKNVLEDDLPVEGGNAELFFEIYELILEEEKYTKKSSILTVIVKR